MQQGQTQQLNYPIVLSSPFTVTSAVLSITGPDGVQLSDIVATVSPNTSSTKQTLSAFFTPALGGKYNAIWKAVVNGTTLQYPFTLFVVWTAAYDAVRSYLGASLATLADSVIDREWMNQDNLLHNYAGGLAPYWQMNGVTDLCGNPYSVDYDNGLALIVASELRLYSGPKRPSGEISLFKKGTTTVQYTSGSKASSESIEQQWRDKGMALLESCIAEIRTAASLDSSGDEVMTRGPLACSNNVCGSNRIYVNRPFPGVDPNVPWGWCDDGAEM